MKHKGKFNSQQQAEEQQQAAAQQQDQQTSVAEFDTVEKMLRHDALHTPVPPTVARRLAESLNQSQPPPNRVAWWRRWFGP